MITTLEHPTPAILRRPMRRAVAVLYLLASAAGIAFYRATWINSPLIATQPAIITQFGPLPSHNGALRGGVVEHPPRFVIGDDQRWVVKLQSRDGSPLQHARLGATVYIPDP